MLHDDSESANGNEFDAESFYRTYLRLKRITSSSPAALAPVLRFPEVFILIVVRGLDIFVRGLICLVRITSFLASFASARKVTIFR